MTVKPVEIVQHANDEDATEASHRVRASLTMRYRSIETRDDATGKCVRDFQYSADGRTWITYYKAAYRPESYRRRSGGFDRT